MDRFAIDQVYGMHNGPGIPVGSFAIRPGPIMAATDAVDIKIEGLGGHAARPHKCIDSVMVGAQLITALQSIVSRSIDPLESAVISICEFHAGNARNVIPQTARAPGHRAHPDQGSARTGREAGARGRRGRGADDRRQDRTGLRARLSRHRQPCLADRCRDPGGEGSRRRSQRPRDAADDGRGGFLLHAGGAARCVHLLRQRQQRRPASPRLQFQRRGDRVSAPRTGSSWSRTRWRRDAAGGAEALASVGPHSTEMDALQLQGGKSGIRSRATAKFFGL